MDEFFFYDEFSLLFLWKLVFLLTCLYFSRLVTLPGRKVAGERFPCPNCQRTYKNKPHLYRHLRSGCGIRKPEAGIDDSHLPVFHCIDPNCGYQTYVRGFLVRHIQIAHGRRT